jgi:putative DNA methylase
MSRQRVLIEDWLPIAEIGAESRRERGASSALPPLYFLHVWWARRPLMASRAAVLGSVLPVWSEEWPDDLLERFPNDKDYHEWFVHLLGVRGDPVAARRRIVWANAQPRKVKLDRAYDGPRAFTLGPDAEQISVFRRLLDTAWGDETPVVLDPMAGGGSIPFESLRFGLQTRANELNPVASFVLQGTLVQPASLGPAFAEDISRWGALWAKRVEERLERFFPREPGESIQAYILARTVACPETGKPVPLAPTWWLRKGPDAVAARLIAESELDACRFELVRGNDIDFDPDVGTVNRGEGRSPWTGATIPGDYIKAEAQAGRMGAQMYGVAIKNSRGRDFRAPAETDLAAVTAAEAELAERIGEWRNADIIPDDDIPYGSKTPEPMRYGMARWVEMFSSRQLLFLGTAVEELRSLEHEMRKDLDPDKVAGLITYLSMGFAKALNYNSFLSSWHAPRGIMRSVFDRHDFSFKWSFAEFDGAHNLVPWAVSQVTDAYRGIADLVEPSRVALFPGHPERSAALVEVGRGDAAALPYADGSIHAVVVDPPYYDNVQYAELSDFFYVWEKLMVGHLYPEFFATDLTDKTTEAVANPARFEALDKKRSKQLAKADYERKMTRVFAEASRVLRDDGVLTVMFTHKKVEAWDTLGQSLIEAGFEIESSWPVHTESEHSLHQARKASAASTILLTCRRRTTDREPAWWDDLQGEVRQVAREKAKEFLAAGIEGVDLYISTFGPTLSVISRQWPVYTSDVDPETGDPRPLRPEEALDLAREEVADLRRRGLLLGHDVEFDPVTDWYLLAWDAFGAIEFPYDEARKLALALGLDLDGELVKLRVVSKKGSSVILQEPKQRRRPGLADPEESSFVRLIDATHALIVAYQEDGVRGAESFLKRTRLQSDARFQALLQALINAIPRTKEKGKFVRPEASALDGLAFLFTGLRFPEEPEIELEPSQAAFDLGGGAIDRDAFDEEVDGDEGL